MTELSNHHGWLALGVLCLATLMIVLDAYSEYRPLFGLMESGYRLAIVLALLFDALTTVLLGAFLALVAPRLVRSFRSRRP